MVSCSGDEEVTTGEYRESMRAFVERIATWARGQDSDFIVIPQNGQELLTQNGEEDGAAESEYISAIDGVGREDLFYGYDADNQATPPSERDYMISFLDIARNNGLSVLVTDYCSGTANTDDSYAKNEAKGYISFAAPSRELDVVPTYPPQPHNVHSGTVTRLSDAKNFLYLINPDGGAYGSRADFIMALIQTDYDVLIIDAFYGDKMLDTVAVGALRN
jgi:cysteinyl-tRNA synthetase